jgi:hypothetical protein
MEATLLGLKQLRSYVRGDAGQEMVESLIEEGEAKLAEVKRKLIGNQSTDHNASRSLRTRDFDFRIL